MGGSPHVWCTQARAGHNWVLAVSPTRPERIYCGAINLWRGDIDNTNHWKPLTYVDEKLPHSSRLPRPRFRSAGLGHRLCRLRRRRLQNGRRRRHLGTPQSRARDFRFQGARAGVSSPALSPVSGQRQHPPRRTTSMGTRDGRRRRRLCDQARRSQRDGRDQFQYDAGVVGERRHAPSSGASRQRRRVRRARSTRRSSTPPITDRRSRLRAARFTSPAMTGRPGSGAPTRARQPPKARPFTSRKKTISTSGSRTVASSARTGRPAAAGAPFSSSRHRAPMPASATSTFTELALGNVAQGRRRARVPLQ